MDGDSVIDYVIICDLVSNFGYQTPSLLCYAVNNFHVSVFLQLGPQGKERVNLSVMVAIQDTPMSRRREDYCEFLCKQGPMRAEGRAEGRGYRPSKCFCRGPVIDTT